LAGHRDRGNRGTTRIENGSACGDSADRVLIASDGITLPSVSRNYIVAEKSPAEIGRRVQGVFKAGTISA
jgi:hypothetical protein